MEKFIGGEPFYPLSLLNGPDKSNVRNFFDNRFPSKIKTYTYGGYYSIKRIIETIDFKDVQEILLPSYMCPTILLPFKEYNVNYRFYKVNSKLEIDIDDLLSRISKNTRAVFFINYFGFQQPQAVIENLKLIQNKGITIIQDLVQAFFATESDMIGDYAFNSFRKFFPVEGSVIFSCNALKDVSTSSNNEYFTNKLLGRIQRWLYFERENINENSFLESFKEANETYRQEGHIEFSSFDEFVINKFDLIFEIKKRQNNFNNLLEKFSDIALFKKLPNHVVPLCFPVILGNRDKIRDMLLDNNIFCPVHWKLSSEVENEYFKINVKLSKNILSIPLGYYDYNELTKIINK